jgi:hypothetical protein
MLVAVEEPEPGWRPGDTISVDLPDGQAVRCRIVAAREDGPIQIGACHPVRRPIATATTPDGLAHQICELQEITSGHAQHRLPLCPPIR